MSGAVIAGRLKVGRTHRTPTPVVREPAGGDGRSFSGVNALRAFAALGVVAFHVNFPAELPRHSLAHVIVGDLDIGVSLFFVISGFLLYRPFARALHEASSVRVGRYAANRALRIFPAYYVAILGAYLLYGMGRNHLDLGKSLIFGSLYTTNPSTSVLGVAWSLDDEILFYLLLPCLYLAARRWARVQPLAWCTRIVVGLALVSVVYRITVINVFHVDVIGTPIGAVLYLNVLSKFELFAAGMLLATLQVRHVVRVSPARALLLVIASFVIVSAGVLSLHSPLRSFGDLIVGIGFAFLVGAVTFSRVSAPLVAILSFPVFIFLGEISYGLYLWHVPVLTKLSEHGWLSRNFGLAFLEAAFGTVLVAAASYLLVERPALRLKSRWAVRRATAPDVLSPVPLGYSFRAGS